jgi:hypothetical protein
VCDPEYIIQFIVFERKTTVGDDIKAADTIHAAPAALRITEFYFMPISDINEAQG